MPSNCSAGLKRLSRSGAWKGPLIATPEHTSHTITEEDELLVVASKGLWNVMSNEEAVQMAREHMKRNTVDIYGTRDATAKKLVRHVM